MSWISPRTDSLTRRILEGLTFLWVLSVVSFGIVKLAPGDAVLSLLRIDTVAVTTEDIEALRAEMGMDKPVLLQYAAYVKNLLTLDLGNSLMTGKPVTYELRHAFPATFVLAGSALGLTVIITLVLGALSARYAGTWIDQACNLFCLVGASVPTFWLGLVLLDIFAVQLRLLPSMGFTSWKGMVLPAVSLAIAMAPPYVKIFRSSLLETGRQEFVRAARARGIPERPLFLRHVLRGSLIPVVTILGVSLGSLLGGTVVVEIIFGLPGIGKLAVEAVARRDYAVIQAFIMFIGILVFLINLTVDLSYRRLDPSITLKGAERR